MIKSTRGGLASAQQNLKGRRIALVVLTGATRWSLVQRHADRIATAIASATASSYAEVEIPFEPRRHRP
jgi:predicted aspartyl protease